MAISGGTATALAFGYELIERPFFKALYKWSRPGGWLGGGSLGPKIHDVTKEGALEYRTNTVGDVVIGSIGGFTASYLALAAYGTPVNPAVATALSFGGPTIGFAATVGIVYGGVIPTRETDTFNTNTFQFERKQVSSELLDPFSPSVAVA